MRSLTISLLFVVIASIFGLGWALDYLFYRYSREPPLDAVSLYQTVGQQLATTLNLAPSVATLIAQWPADSALQARLTDLSNLPLPDSLQASFLNGEPVLLESRDQLNMHYYLARHSQVLTLTPTHRVRSGATGLQAGFTALFYVGMFALTSLWLYPLLKRLFLLSRTAQQFGQGELSARLKPTRFSYIRELESEFNRMAHRIQTLVEDNKLLSSAVSHDLRTPLARLRFGIDTLTDTTDSATRHKYITRINNDLSEMERLVTSLLRFARLDNTLNSGQRQIIDLAALCEECLSQYQDEPVSIDFNYNQDCATIQANPDFLAMAVNNLLQNAFRYSSKRVRVSITPADRQLVLQISDDGPGIAAEHRNDALKPFRRITSTVTDGNSPSQGYGLGLAIVARIAAWHQATLAIDCCPLLGGARITITIQQATTRIHGTPTDVDA